VRDDLNVWRDQRFSNGYGDGEANIVHYDEVTIVAGGVHNIALTSGTDVTPFGEDIDLTGENVKALLIVNASDETPTGATVEIGESPPGNNWQGPFGSANDIVVVEPGDLFLWSSASGQNVYADNYIPIHNTSGTEAALVRFFMLAAVTT
jgi:hypothetical protein